MLQHLPYPGLRVQTDLSASFAGNPNMELAMVHRVTETFFMPPPLGSSDWHCPADIYNLSHTLLARGELDYVFVPIRSMQYLAIASPADILFVDSQAYAYQGNEGGRLIMLSWKFDSAAHRTALNEPVDCEVIRYHEQSEQIQQRLVNAYRESLQQIDKRYRDKALPAGGARIIKLSTQRLDG